MAELEINRKTIPKGEVAYFLENTYQIGRKKISYGIVEEHYHSEIVLQLYEPFDRRTINGVPIKEFETPTKWMKLPKGWTYSTQLFELGTNDWKIDKAKKPFDFKNPANIKEAITEGLLVKVQDNDHCSIETEIDKKEGFRIIRRYPMFDYHPTYVSKLYNEVYVTYDEAKAEMDAIEAEYMRISNLSDLEWSWEQIEKSLSKAIFFGYITEEQAEDIRKRINDLGNVEDLNTRVSKNTVQWRYEKEKRWKSFY